MVFAFTVLFMAIVLIVGFYMAWTIGANDVANSMGTSVGSGALTLKEMILVAAIFEFAGAVIIGAHVTDTVRKGIIDPMAFENNVDIFAYGMMAALLAAALWITLATRTLCHQVRCTSQHRFELDNITHHRCSSGIFDVLYHQKDNP